MAKRTQLSGPKSIEGETIKPAATKPSEKLFVPEYDDLANAATDGRSIARATGNGPHAEGLYQWSPAASAYVPLTPWEDRNDDGVVSLRGQAADFGGGDARNILQQSFSPTEVVAGDSPYVTQGESVLYVDTTNGTVTVTLSSEDAVDGNVVEIYDVGENAGTNAITIDTEGSETINPGGKSSITISLNGAYAKFKNRGGNWFSDRHAQRDELDARLLSSDEASISEVAALVYLSGSLQTVSTATVTKVQFDSIELEDVNVLDVDTTNNNITVQKAGTYFVSPQIKWNADTGWSTADYAELLVKVNGAIVEEQYQRKVGTDAQGVGRTYVGDLAVGDTITVAAYQDSGAGKDIANSQPDTRIQVGRLG